MENSNSGTELEASNAGPSRAGGNLLEKKSVQAELNLPQINYLESTTSDVGTPASSQVQAVEATRKYLPGVAEKRTHGRAGRCAASSRKGGRSRYYIYPNTGRANVNLDINNPAINTWGIAGRAHAKPRRLRPKDETPAAVDFGINNWAAAPPRKDAGFDAAQTGTCMDPLCHSSGSLMDDVELRASPGAQPSVPSEDLAHSAALDATIPLGAKARHTGTGAPPDTHNKLANQP